MSKELLGKALAQVAGDQAVDFNKSITQVATDKLRTKIQTVIKTSEEKMFKDLK